MQKKETKIKPFSFTLIPGFFLCVLMATVLTPQIALSDDGRASVLHKKADKTLAQEQYSKAIRLYESILVGYPHYNKLMPIYYSLIKAYKMNGDIAKLPAIYEKIINETSNPKEIITFQKEFYKINTKLLFSPTPTPESIIYTVRAGDALSKIARQYDTTVDLLKIANGLKSDLIRIGQKLKVTTALFNVIIDKSLNKLFLKKNDSVFKSYDISTGMNNSSPVGTFQIVNKLVDPTWYSLDAVVPPGSPKNILGSRWMGISLPSYGIHGTVDPETIGQQNTAGCIRLANADVEELYVILPIGTEVKIID